jgi:hypothetical protein
MGNDTIVFLNCHFSSIRGKEASPKHVSFLDLYSCLVHYMPKLVRDRVRDGSGSGCFVEWSISLQDANQSESVHDRQLPPAQDLGAPVRSRRTVLISPQLGGNGPVLGVSDAARWNVDKARPATGLAPRRGHAEKGV